MCPDTGRQGRNRRHCGGLAGHGRGMDKGMGRGRALQGSWRGITLCFCGGLGKNKGGMRIIRTDTFDIGGVYTVHSLISIYRSMSVCTSVVQKRYRGTYTSPVQAQTRLGHVETPPIPNTSLRMEHITPLFFFRRWENYRRTPPTCPQGYPHAAQGVPGGIWHGCTTKTFEVI